MRIFRALCRRGYTPGDIYRGKRRIVAEVTWADRQKLRNYYDIEEENMFYLRNPYLTLEQSRGHSTALGKSAKRWELIKESKKKEFKEDVSIEARLGHLRHSEAWD